MCWRHWDTQTRRRDLSPRATCSSVCKSLHSLWNQMSTKLNKSHLVGFTIREPETIRQLRSFGETSSLSKEFLDLFLWLSWQSQFCLFVCLFLPLAASWVACERDDVGALRGEQYSSQWKEIRRTFPRIYLYYPRNTPQFTHFFFVTETFWGHRDAFLFCFTPGVNVWSTDLNPDVLERVRRLKPPVVHSAPL